ncbi:MAG: type II toxin-antitoxin system RelE/ParE family toxin [Thermomicrobiales bacterium]
MVSAGRTARSRDEYFLGGHSQQVEHHVIYYRIEETAIVVIRILHARQDATGQLVEQPDQNP